MASDNLTVWLAFGAGLASFLSPCVLPLIPAYFSYLVGSSSAELHKKRNNRERWLLITRASGFILGFTLVFVALGSTASLIGSFFYRYQDTIRKIGGILVIIFGIYLTGLMPLRFLYRERRVSFLPKTKGFLSAILMGMAFAAGWTPCISPILASILIYAGTVKTVATGAWLLAVYSLGLGVPFFLAAVLLEYFAGFHRRFSRYLPWVSRIGGVLLVVLGIMLYFDRLASLSF